MVNAAREVHTTEIAAWHWSAQESYSRETVYWCVCPIPSKCSGSKRAIIMNDGTPSIMTTRPWRSSKTSWSGKGDAGSALRKHLMEDHGLDDADATVFVTYGLRASVRP